MAGASTFADVLDRHLQVDPFIYSCPAGIATPSIWPASTIADWPAIGGCREAYARHARASSPGAFAKPRRQLTQEQRAALLTLGSAAREPLDCAFDHVSLKCAFRRAARRLHPDAHPDADTATKRQLEAAFTMARDAYLTLLALTS